MTLTVFDNADLAQDVASGAFVPAAEREIVLEIRDFIAGLSGCTSFIEAGHDTNMVHFDGVLPARPGKRWPSTWSNAPRS